MKPASAKQIKDALKSKDDDELLTLINRLATFKKENKELLTYLLFEEDDEISYLNAVKEEMRIKFSEIDLSTPYRTKKGLRKVIKYMDRMLKYTKVDSSHVELKLFFCQGMKAGPFGLERSKVLRNMYDVQFSRILKLVDKLHEDLKFDYAEQVESLN